MEIVPIAQTMCVSVEIVVISSHCMHFSGNSCNWLRLCAFHLRKLQFIQTTCDSVEIATIGLECVCFICNSCNWLILSVFQLR